MNIPCFSWFVRSGLLVGTLLVLSAPMPSSSQLPPPSTVPPEASEPLPEGESAQPTSGDPSAEIEPAQPASGEPSVEVEPAPSEPVEPVPDAKPADPGATEPPVESGADLSPERRQQLFIEADRLWQQGRFEDAEFLYRKAKNPFRAVSVSDRPDPIYDPAQLPPAGQVYWREAEAGWEANLETRMMVPLALLTEQYPQFIPGHLRYAERLILKERSEEALQVLEQAATLYPDQADLIRTRVTALADHDHWLEASIAARQFAVLYPENPAAAELATLAEENLRQFQSNLRERMTGNAIANVLTGALSYALTGGLAGPISAIQTSVLLLRGESDVGESAANHISRQIDLVEDEAIVSYVNELGQQLARVSGRTNFEYEFYIVQDEELNAFALPGGKIFVNAGAILKANSEAELAGLLAHELAHAVLSHGFQLMTEGNTTANFFDLIPYGGIVSDLLVLNYSRDMERQADALGTRMLAASGYAADGLRNLMVTLEDSEEADPTPVIEWLSTHPDTDERIRTMELLIERNGYNRYAYEGVERHLDIQQRLRSLLNNDAQDSDIQEDEKE